MRRRFQIITACFALVAFSAVASAQNGRTKIEASAKRGGYEANVTLEVEGEKVVGFGLNATVAINESFHDCDFTATEGDGKSDWTRAGDTTAFTSKKSGQRVTIQKLKDKFVVAFATASREAEGECSGIALPRRITLTRAGRKFVGRLEM